MCIRDSPGTFPVQLDAFYPDLEGRLQILQIDALSDGAVCFAGRDDRGSPMLRLVMTEMSSDGVLAALASLNEDQVAQRTRTILRTVRSSPDLRRLMAQGLDLKGVNDKTWKDVTSEAGASLGLLAWNYPLPDVPLSNGHLSKAGVVLLIRDAGRSDVPGLDDAIRSGLIQPVIERANQV